MKREKIINNISELLNMRSQYKKSVENAPKAIYSKLRSLIPSKESHNYYPRDEYGKQMPPSPMASSSSDVYTPRSAYYTPKSSIENSNASSKVKMSPKLYNNPGQFDDSAEYNSGDNAGDLFYNRVSAISNESTPRRMSFDNSSRSTSFQSAASHVLTGDDDFNGLNDDLHSQEENSGPDLTRANSKYIGRGNNTIFKPMLKSKGDFKGPGNFGAYG